MSLAHNVLFRRSMVRHQGSGFELSLANKVVLPAPVVPEQRDDLAGPTQKDVLLTSAGTGC